MRTLLGLLSLLLSLVLVGELWWYLGRDRELVPVPPPSVVASKTETVLPPKEAFKLQDEQNYEIVLDRPLFVEGRRPPEDTPEVAQQPAENLPAPNLTLLGVFIVPKGPTALVRNESTKETSRLRLDDILDGWKVTKIEADRLVVQKGGEKHAVDLRDFSKPAASRPAPKKRPSRQLGTRNRTMPGLPRTPTAAKQTK